MFKERLISMYALESGGSSAWRAQRESALGGFSLSLRNRRSKKIATGGNRIGLGFGADFGSFGPAVYQPGGRMPARMKKACSKIEAAGNPT